ncbi:MAG: DUF1501 domain-containing protein, partial [Planctomycetaceae bacterium]|nr:DUF1501 domain-containing protein [Planctomycetaceae bacterium]
SNPLGRRSFLRVGTLGVGGLALSQLLAARAHAAAESPMLTGKSVIFVFLHGGPSQIETFDPKMTAPDGIRSATGEIATALPGITFGSTLPKLAYLADRFTVVRSFVAGDGNHDIKPIVSRDSASANLGSLYARVAGTNHPQTGMPLNVALFPRAVEPEAQPEQSQFGRFTSTGGLGMAYAPFVPGAGGDLQSDMQLALPRERFDDRRGLLAQIDRLRRSADASGLMQGTDRFQQQAFDTILGGIANAFDWTREAPATVARYDTKPLVPADSINTRWNNRKFYIDHNATLGKLLLVSRRLVEAGCGFVTVTTNFVWDNHADVNNAGVVEGMRYCSVALDHALSALVEDLEVRGLGRDVLVVVCGEMGRTPRINKNGGRDHWGGLAPLFLYGGGWKMGQVIGQSTKDAGQPSSEPVTIPNLVSTVMHTLFDGGRLRLRPDVPGDISRLLSAADPIRGL